MGDNEYGLLVDVDDMVAMKNAMKEAIGNETMRLKFEKNAYERVKEFDKIAVAKQLVRYLGD